MYRSVICCVLFVCALVAVALSVPVAAVTLNPQNNHYYEVVVLDTAIVWEQAHQAAQQRSYGGLRGHLATVATPAEQQWLQANLDAMGGAALDVVFLGGHQDRSAPDYSEPSGGWMWVTDEPWTDGYGWSQPPYDTEPNNSGGNEDVLCAIRNRGWAWNDVPGDWPYRGYVVEYESSDTTPPSTPSVMDDGNTTANLASLHAAWASVDSESGIAEYQYAIGPTEDDAGSGYIVGWTCSGTETEATETGLQLLIGQAYYWYVKARNGEGLWSGVGASDGILAVGPPRPLGEAKLLADNEPIALEANCVTYAAADFFYVEEDSRAMGIRVEKAGHGLAVGMRADVAGTMNTNTARERSILAASAVQNGECTIAPVGMTNMSLGGEDWRVDGTKGQKGVSGAMGLNNVGLLVRVWGTFLKLDETTFTVDDGSGPVTCTMLPPVRTPGPTWRAVAVTAVVSVSSLSPSLFAPLLLVRELTATHTLDSEMVYIPAGSFLMGNNGNERWSYDDELPQHSVYLSDYWIGKYEVTRGEYRKFIDAGGYSNPAYWSSAGWDWKVSKSRTEPLYWAATQTWAAGRTFTQTESHPVVGVTYYEAEAYCAWAGGHLPTEAQWEKAARWTGSYPNVYPWGNVWDNEKCNNMYDNSPAGGGSYGCQTAPAGSYPLGASPYGLQDMAGNVWEWCRDWYSFSFYSVSPSEDPQGPTSGGVRALRGASWKNYGLDSFERCADRGVDGITSSSRADRGFRIAR